MSTMQKLERYVNGMAQSVAEFIRDMDEDEQAVGGIASEYVSQTFEDSENLEELVELMTDAVVEATRRLLGESTTVSNGSIYEAVHKVLTGK